MEIHEEYRPTPMGTGHIAKSEHGVFYDAPGEAADARVLALLEAWVERIKAEGPLAGFALVALTRSDDNRIRAAIGVSVPPEEWDVVLDCVATAHRGSMEQMEEEA